MTTARSIITGTLTFGSTRRSMKRQLRLPVGRVGFFSGRITAKVPLLPVACDARYPSLRDALLLSANALKAARVYQGVN